MARPTEPGYYWLNRHYGGWEIVKVFDDGYYACIAWDSSFRVDDHCADEWGGKITQEPAPDPPPPF